MTTECSFQAWRSIWLAYIAQNLVTIWFSQPSSRHYNHCLELIFTTLECDNARFLTNDRNSDLPSLAAWYNINLTSVTARSEMGFLDSLALEANVRFWVTRSHEIITRNRFEMINFVLTLFLVPLLLNPQVVGSLRLDRQLLAVVGREIELEAALILHYCRCDDKNRRSLCCSFSEYCRRFLLGESQQEDPKKNE